MQIKQLNCVSYWLNGRLALPL